MARINGPSGVAFGVMSEKRLATFAVSAVGFVAAEESNTHAEARVYRLPDTPVTATYGASVTKTLQGWVIALSITFAFAFIAFLWVMHLAMEEYICFDRSPWWGPPEDPNSTCTGHWYESKHPGAFPWTLPH
jgi:hypothetical protein